MRRIHIFSNDARFKYAAEFLRKEVDVCGPITRFGSEKLSEIILLPVPFSIDGITIKGTEIEIEAFFEKVKMSDVSCIICGMPGEALITFCKNSGITLVDYMKNEELVKANAILTARGLMEFAKKQGAVLRESSSLVIGYGHCGTEVAKHLRKEGANVEVMLRNKKQFPRINKDGFTPIEMFTDLKEKEKYMLEKYSYVFNTVPALILDGEAIRLLADNVMIFDIASKPGGTDYNYCYEHEVFAENVLAIPGNYYPREAGEIISKVVLKNVRYT